MQIPLSQFEQYIDETTLKRGLQYYKKGHVHEPEHRGGGEVVAIVEGTTEYMVTLHIQNRIIVEHACTCPYDWGSVCKHATALIFHLLQEELDLAPPKKKKTSTKPKAVKSNTQAQQVEVLLNRLSHDELKEFIRNQTSEDKLLRNLFLTSFAQSQIKNIKSLYKSLLKSVIKSAGTRTGYINAENTKKVGKEVQKIFNKAKDLREANDYKNAFTLYTIVLEQLNEARYHADDRFEILRQGIDFAITQLTNMGASPMSAEVRQEIRQYFFNAFENEKLCSLKSKVVLLEVAAAYIETEAEMNTFFTLIDNTRLWGYDYDRACVVKFDLLLKISGEEAAGVFTQEHYHVPYFRDVAIQEAIKEEAYDDAITFAEDGLELNTEKGSFLHNLWTKHLLTIAILQNKVPDIIKHARTLFMHIGQEDEATYYAYLKQYVSNKEWNAFLVQLITDLQVTKKSPDVHLVARIYINEGWWDKLLALVQKYPYFEFIELYEQQLAPHYSVEIIGLYEKNVERYLEENVGRDHYQYACRMIRRIIKLGGKDIAHKIVLYLRQKYPNRIALMDELNML